MAAVKDGSLIALDVDTLLKRLSDSGFNSQGYSNDLIITVRDNHKAAVLSPMSFPLNILGNWCEMKGFKDNPGI